jgi:translation initiation factor IF-3
MGRKGSPHQSIRLFAAPKQAKQSNPIITESNFKEKLKGPEVRLVYSGEDGKKGHEITTIMAVLVRAKEESSFCVMVNDKTVPPIVKLGSGNEKSNKDKNQQQKKANYKKKKDAKKGGQTKRSSMMLRSFIGQRDMDRKMNRVKEFLLKGRQVNITIVDKMVNFRKNPLMLDETVLRVVATVEPFAAHVQAPSQLHQLRRTFSIMPLNEKLREAMIKKISNEGEDALTLELLRNLKKGGAVDDDDDDDDDDDTDDSDDEDSDSDSDD